MPSLVSVCVCVCVCVGREGEGGNNLMVTHHPRFTACMSTRSSGEMLANGIDSRPGWP